MSNRKSLLTFYETHGQEEYRLQEGSVHRIEFLTATKYFAELFQPKSNILDNCAGTGAYAFYLAEQGHQITAGDIVPFNVEIMQKKQAKQKRLQEIYLGDVLNLSRFANESFDVVLCMGAFYHLLTAKERRQALKENLRILKKGGLFIATYMNRYAVILGDMVGDLENLDEILRFKQQGTEDIFYASTPEEAETFFLSEGLKQVKHIALDGMALFLTETSKLLTPNGLKRWLTYHLKTCEEKSLLGSSYHGMWIGQK